MNELSALQECVVVRGGIQIWVSEEKAAAVKAALRNIQGRAMIEIEGRMINAVDLVGVFLPEDIEEMTRRKNGQWQCDHGYWHNRNEKCDCAVSLREFEARTKTWISIAGLDEGAVKRNRKKIAEMKKTLLEKGLDGFK